MQVGHHVEYLDRDDFAILKNKRRTKVGERPYKHNDSPGKITWKHQRKGNRAKKFEAARSHVLCRFLKAGIDIRQRCCQIQIHERVKMKHFKDYHAPKTPAAQPVD